MPDAQIFKCKVCGELVDITNKKRMVKAKAKDGREYDRTIKEQHGYGEVRFMDYGSRTTVAIAACASCRQKIQSGKNDKTLTGDSSQWPE